MISLDCVLSCPYKNELCRFVGLWIYCCYSVLLTAKVLLFCFQMCNFFFGAADCVTLQNFVTIS